MNPIDVYKSSCIALEHILQCILKTTYVVLFYVVRTTCFLIVLESANSTEKIAISWRAEVWCEGFAPRLLNVGLSVKTKLLNLENRFDRKTHIQEARCEGSSLRTTIGLLNMLYYNRISIIVYC